MKNCRDCMKEIDKKAKKCPYCQTDQRNWFIRHKIITGLLILFVFLSISAYGNSDTTSKSSSSSKTVTPSPIADKVWVEDMGQKYYESHVNMRWSGTQFYNGPLTLEAAKKLISQCLETFESKEKCQQIVDKKYWIGMSEVWSTMSVGNPNKINTTVVSGLTRKQYVYGDPIYGATYLYFDNDILTSYQQ